MYKRYLGRKADVSRLFIYYNSRRIRNGNSNVADIGATNKDMARALHEFGACKESVWPYDPHLINKKPPSSVYKAAREITIVPLEIPHDLTAMKICLANRIPFVISIELMPSAYKVAQVNGSIIPMPNLADPKVGTQPMTHSVLVVGYDDRKKVFILRNSWGNYWVKLIRNIFRNF